MKILHLDTNHPLLIKALADLGVENHEDYTSSKIQIENKISDYQGIIIRSRFAIDREFLKKATALKFIGRVGAGVENIDVEFANKQGIKTYNAPEGNQNAVAEHTLAMLLSLFNNLNKADRQIRKAKWQREANRGIELDGKTVGIIGYGNMGKAFAKKLSSFSTQVLCNDILENVGNEYAQQVSISELKKRADVISLHVPQTAKTIGMIDTKFINGFTKPFWLLNTARGSVVNTTDLVKALKSRKILGAGLDVLEYEKSSFESFFQEIPQKKNIDASKSTRKKIKALKYLTKASNVLLTPHIAGWTFESYQKLAQIIVDKIKADFFPDS